MSHSFYYGSSVVHNNTIHVLGGESEKTAHYKMTPSVQYMCKIRVVSKISIIGGDDLIIHNSDNIEQTSNELSVPGIYYIYTKEPFVIK